MRRIKVCSVALVLLLFCAGCGTGKGWREMSMGQASLWMEEHTGYLLVDVRTEAEFRSGHIASAVLIPIEEIRAGHLDALPDKEQTILLYCRTGRRAEDAAGILTELGYQNVYSIGGIFDWTGEVVTEAAEPGDGT